MENRDSQKNEWVQSSCTAFHDSCRIASGALPQVALAAKEVLEGNPLAGVLIFDDATSARIEVDLRGSADDVLGRLTQPVLEPETPPGPGRPKLGVVAREVTLLPRHWDWLSHQPGGASVALRKLVEEARRTHNGQDRIRQSQESAYRFLSVMAGDRAGFEEATRALFAGDGARFDALASAWPADIWHHARKLADAAFNGHTGDISA